MKMRTSMNRYFGLKLKIIRQDYLEAEREGEFKKYPLIEQEILNTLKLIDCGFFDLKKLKKVKKRKFFQWNEETLNQMENYRNEYIRIVKAKLSITYLFTFQISLIYSIIVHVRITYQ